MKHLVGFLIRQIALEVICQVESFLCLFFSAHLPEALQEGLAMQHRRLPSVQGFCWPALLALSSTFHEGRCPGALPLSSSIQEGLLPQVRRKVVITSREFSVQCLSTTFVAQIHYKPHFLSFFSYILPVPVKTSLSRDLNTF